MVIRWCIACILVALLLPSGTRAQAQPQSIALGADLSEAQRAALLARFGQREGDKIVTINTDETRTAMQNIIPLPEGYTSVSSAALTCGAPGSGLNVTTENITRVSAAMYASALVTAGINDAKMVVAAPQDAPAEGMTALAGMFKTFEGGACSRAEVDVARRELAYRQLDVTSKIANAIGGEPADALTKAAEFVLRTQRVLIDTNNNPDAAVPIVEGVQRDSGITLPQENFDQLVLLLATIAQSKVDWGSYAANWTPEVISVSEVRITPDSGGPAAGNTGGADGQSLIGTVTSISPLRVSVPGASAQLRLDANNVEVVRNDEPARLEDLQPGDAVTIRVGPNNVAQQIIAQSGGASFTARGNEQVGTAVGAAEGNTLNVSIDGTNQRIPVGRGVTITRNGRSATLADIRANDTVTLVRDADGVLTGIRASSETASSSRLDLTRYLPYLALLLVGLIGLLFILSRRRPRQAVLVEPGRRTVMDEDELEDELDERIR